MGKNAFLDRIEALVDGMDRFRREQGYLADPDGYAARDLISLETEALVRLSLGQSFEATEVAKQLQDAYRTAVAHQIIDTEQVAAAYTRLLPDLKAPIDDLIWAEDACLYNQYLEEHLANRDYATMTYLLVRQQVETLVAHMRDGQGQAVVA